MIAAVRSFARLVGNTRRLLAASTIIAVGQALLLLPAALLVRTAFDHTIPAGRVGRLVGQCALLVGLLLASTALGLWTRNLVLAANKKAVGDLRVALLAKLQALPAAWYDSTDRDRLHATVVQGTERVDVLSNALGGQLAPAVVIAAALAAVLLSMNPELFGLLAVVLPAMLLLGRHLGSRVRSRTREWREAFESYSVRMQLAIRGREAVRAQATEAVELASASAEIKRLTETGRAMALLQYTSSQVNGLLAGVAGVVVLALGGAEVARHEMSLGSLLSFYALVLLLRGQLSSILLALPELLSGAESLASLEAILATTAREPYDGTRRIAFRGKISLRDVHFGYLPEAPVLAGLNLELEAGEQLAVAGPNGTGKTTLAMLLLGFHRPWSGSLLADGVRYDELDIADLRRRIAYVPQDPFLVPGTIAENIRFGDPSADEQRIRAAAQASTADEVVRLLPAGYETRIGQDGTLLSGGERRRIMLARALLRRPALLILDEPTAMLDAGATVGLLSRLRGLPGGPSVLVISHDQAVLAQADRFVTIERLASPAEAEGPVTQGDPHRTPTAPH